jgi:hypothetical protein
MKIAAAFSIWTLCGLSAFAQVVVSPPPEEFTFGGLSTGSHKPLSAAYPLGMPHSKLALEGWMVCSDGKSLSIELSDQRVIRFELEAKIQYFPERGSPSLASFRMADLVRVDAEIDSRGLVLARSVRFLRRPTAAEQEEVSQSPEVMQAWHGNVLAGRDLDAAADDRKLSLVSKPEPVSLGSATLISRVRQSVEDQFENLPSLRAKQITSMFRSTSKPLKWVPDGVVTSEVAYEDDREAYSDLTLNGKQLSGAPETVNADFMRSMDKAWSTGDFKTISHCVFDELADSDFTPAGTTQSNGETLAVFDFRGRRSSGCIGVNFRSEITYPAFKGSLQVRPQTGELLHVELEATEIPQAFPLDRAERSVDFSLVRIGAANYLLPKTAYWFGCFRNTYSCFLNRIDFRDYRRFTADSTVQFEK